jgi:hypothetical protein
LAKSEFNALGIFSLANQWIVWPQAHDLRDLLRLGTRENAPEDAIRFKYQFRPLKRDQSMVLKPNQLGFLLSSCGIVR